MDQLTAKNDKRFEVILKALESCDDMESKVSINSLSKIYLAYREL